MSNAIAPPKTDGMSSSQNRINPNVVKRVHREVRFGQYILGSTLGEGEFGKVKLGWRKDGKQPSQVAIKLIKRETIMKDSESEIKIHREINSLKMLNHPNIVNLVEVMKSGKYIGIVLEYASGGELFDFILHHKYLKENVAKKLFAQLVSGVDYMHAKGLIHRDLKLENLLLDKHKNVIISDFGFVNSYNKDKNDFMKTSCGSPCYAAPELVLTQSPYEGRKVDIWSLGVILYAMLSGYLPFDDDPENEDGADIVKLYHYICRTPLTFPEYVSPLARDLLRKIIVPDPRKRIGMNEIRNHPWLAPHANLISIRQPEWDKIYRDSKQNRSVNDVPNKRFSMINERTNSSSLMMSGNTRSYSTNNMGNLYSNPSTSSSLANAVALTKQPTSSGNSDNPSGRSSSSPTKTVRGHAKSSSVSNAYPSASIALKAMVSDRRASFTAREVNDPISTPPTTKSAFHFPSPSHLPRSTTYTGTAISTIVESPGKQEDPVILGLAPAIDTSVGQSAANSISNASSKDSNKLPHSYKKPRPTSYHPSSLSSSLMTNPNQSANALLDYFKISPPVNMTIPPFLSSPTKNGSSDNTNEFLNSSPTKSIASVHSRRDSVVTPVHVNGVLSTEATSLSSHENKRNSVLSYLEDKMESLELNDQISSPKTAEKSNTVTPQINQSPVFDNHPSSPTKKVEEKKKEFTDKVILEQPQMSPEESVESKISDNGSKGLSSKFQSNEKQSSEIMKERTRRLSTGRQESRNNYKQNGEANKENKEAKKRNRFSILSFYSNYSSSTSSSTIPNIHSSTPGPIKKILEPSTDINVMTPPGKPKHQVRVNSNSSSKTSSSKKSNNSNGTSASSVNGKEASAAKKVMDFFKRRSVRIG